MINDEIVQEIVNVCREGKQEATKEEIAALKEQLDIISSYMSEKEEVVNEKSQAYWDAAKLGRSYYLKGAKRITYPKVLEAITKILDILRGQPLEIVIQKIERQNGEIVGITTYKGKESSLITKYNSKTKQVEYDLETSKQYLEKEEKATQAYVNHYSNFYKIANAHIKSTRSHVSRTGWRRKLNEGNIVEAFQRHMNMTHSNADFQEQYTDKFNDKEVIILLYQSAGNVPWWEQGDLGYLQVKANNVRLASEISIRRVATKLLSYFDDLENFNKEEFYQLFTAKDISSMTDTDKWTKEQIDAYLLKEAAESGLFKDINKATPLTI